MWSSLDENISINKKVAQILLDLNIAPHELNCLIVEYQKPNLGDLVGGFKITNEKGLAIYEDYIYTVDSRIK